MICEQYGSETNIPIAVLWVRLGPEYRTFFVTMFHEQHCIQYLEGILTGIEVKFHAHVQHCLNYMLQLTLCDADLTLEPSDFATREFGMDREGQTHLCRDWEKAYDEATMNWVEWYKYRKTHETARAYLA